MPKLFLRLSQCQNKCSTTTHCFTSNYCYFNGVIVNTTSLIFFLESRYVYHLLQSSNINYKNQLKDKSFTCWNSNYKKIKIKHDPVLPVPFLLLYSIMLFTAFCNYIQNFFLQIKFFIDYQHQL